ncbi:DsbA family protein [Enterobacter hormaechei]|uniref:DsbA family protein n=1 Tax=Enterobacter hormaechei TaxID=158836 RepID=UPI000F8214AD|nr:DsbA family protein [Enterobacter hormaechei]RTO30634.1 DsbA family protein [Enterobacter hormaechei]HAV1476378.1 thioredoxin domain-containing protein [Enterobacter hormaechei subsp. steigerwaltii]HAV1694280.1 thioredoxin domain-containing protein [Enterobacter hormaechei subsp. steigerwaltii]HAV1738858.1 thioredoxin domain-containing protein [Enterobacter hormaechei subsp. steigerwaltii]
MKYIILMVTLFLSAGVSIAKESEALAPEKEKIDTVIHDLLFNDPASPQIGAKKAKLTLVNFTDYNCPYCKRLDPLLEKIVQKYPDVAVIIKPLPFKGESSVLSARTALDTWRVNPEKFPDLHANLMEHRGYHTAASVKKAKEKSKIPLVTLDEKSMDTIKTNLQLARLIGVRGTPATVIGNELVPGAVSWEILDKLVKEKLAETN